VPAADGPLVLSVDQGTSSTKAVVLDATGAVVASASVPLSQAHPRPGWAEQDPMEIWASVPQAVRASLDGLDARRVVGVGLSTQRESTLLWDRATGVPLGPVLGWQDNRGSAICAGLRERGLDGKIRAASGLPIDPMWSSSKATWLLDAHDPDRARSRRGELCLGTVDSWLVWCLGGGHVIEAGNASRTQLLDLSSRAWDPELLDIFRVPAEVLPTVVPSAGTFASAGRLAPLGDDVPVAAVLGDSHSAVFAHGIRRPGQVKATYGTGSSVMGLTDGAGGDTGELCRTLAWQTDRDLGSVAYAVEGNIRSSGATLMWLADLFDTAPADLAITAAPDSGGVTLVPAFTGLGAPWWDDTAVAVISGLGFGTRKPQLARAALESIAFQVEDVVAAVEREVGRIDTVHADGGATANRDLMQLQADTSGRTVQRATARDLSALGAAQLAGVAVGLWTHHDLETQARDREAFAPREDQASRGRRQAAWHDAVARSRFAPDAS